VYRERGKVKREIHNGEVIVEIVARMECDLTLNTVAIMPILNPRIRKMMSRNKNNRCYWGVYVCDGY